MGVFYREEPPNHPKRCKCIVTTLKELFSHCQTFGGRLSTATLEVDEEYPMSDFDEEQEVFISAVISQAMENQKHKPSVLRHSFSWVYSPATKEMYVTQTMATQERVEGDQEQDEREEYFSVKSCLSCCSSSLSHEEAFYSVKTNLSRCSSLNELELGMSKYWRRSVIQEFCNCEGWPFGLCRRAVLFPPLPKPPSESWLSRQIQTSTKKP